MQIDVSPPGFNIKVLRQNFNRIFITANGAEVTLFIRRSRFGLGRAYINCCCPHIDILIGLSGGDIEGLGNIICCNDSYFRTRDRLEFPYGIRS